MYGCSVGISLLRKQQKTNITFTKLSGLKVEKKKLNIYILYLDDVERERGGETDIF